MNKKLSKTKFIYIINTIKKYEGLMNDFCNLLEKMSNEEGRCDAFIYSEYLNMTIKLLEEFFDEFDMNTIQFFMFDLDFGTKYTKGCILDQNNDPIDISTVEKLANYLELGDENK